MPERYKTASAVMLFLLRGQNGKQEILLQKRQNTGYADGMWDCGASGHVEAGETMRAAMAREAAEELGLASLLPRCGLQRLHTKPHRTAQPM